MIMSHVLVESWVWDLNPYCEVFLILCYLFSIIGNKINGVMLIPSTAVNEIDYKRRKRISSPIRFWWHKNSFDLTKNIVLLEITQWASQAGDTCSVSVSAGIFSFRFVWTIQFALFLYIHPNSVCTHVTQFEVLKQTFLTVYRGHCW